MEKSIRRAVAVVIAEDCNCSFSEDYIAVGIMTCTSTFLQQIVYRSAVTMVPSGINSSQVIGILKEWVESSAATIDTEAFILAVDSNCAVHIKSLNDPLCYEPDTVCPDEYSLFTRDINITSTARSCLRRLFRWPHILGQGCTPAVGRRRLN